MDYNDNMNNEYLYSSQLFNNAEFGSLYKTRGGRKACYFGTNDGMTHMFMVENCHNFITVDNNGFHHKNGGITSNLDIVSQIKN